jgi:replicative DNA helicase
MTNLLDKIQQINKLSKELEKKVLSSVILEYEKESAVKILTSLREKDFFHYPVYYALLKESIDTKNDYRTLLDNKGLSWTEIANVEYVVPSKWEIAIDELRRVGLAREYILKTYYSIENSNYKDIENEIASHIRDLSLLSIFRGQKIDSKDGVRGFEKYQEEVSQKFKAGESTIGIPTGFRTLDSLSEGLLARTLTILGGYSGAGKTSLAVNIMRNILLEKKRVVMFSLEMGASEIFTKLIALGASINPMKMLKGYLNETEAEQMSRSKAEVYEMKLEIYDDVRDFDKIKMAMIKESMTDKPDLFVIDYLQMIADPKFKTIQERLSSVVNELKGVAKQTDIPILAISSISNDSAKTQNDEVGGYKGSGDIEFASDLALKLINTDDRATRDEMKKNRKPVYIDLVITKQRHGATGAIQMSFEGYTGKITEGRKPRI